MNDEVAAYDHALHVHGDPYRHRPLGMGEQEYDARIVELRNRMTYKIIPTALFLNGSRIDSLPTEPGDVITGANWGMPDAIEFVVPWQPARLFLGHKSRKPALAFFTGVEYVHVSKAARLLEKHRERDGWPDILPPGSSGARKRTRRLLRIWARETPTTDAAWRAKLLKRARNG